MYDTGENKKNYQEQIQREKHFMGPGIGISMPLRRKFWIFC
jgi:hypothetical protein